MSEWIARAMRRALALARRGEGHVEPNPMVGCVIARDGQVLGEGWHGRFGGPHAEIVALEAAGDAARGATMVVTLEPCCHHGKTPPCTEAIVRAGIRRVVAAHEDPFPAVSGRGLRELRDAGVEVETGLMRREAAEILAPYVTRLCHGRPWMIAKFAMTWDGKIATRTGDSRWISGEPSRSIVHRLRGRVDGILVGRGTALRDDPLLTARPPGPRVATRIVLDSRAQLPESSRLARTARDVPVLVVAAHDAPESRTTRLRQAGCEVWQVAGDSRERVARLLEELAKRGMTNVLVEGGAQVLGALFDQHLIDELHVFAAPKLVGGDEAPSPVAGLGRSRIAEACRIAHPTYEIVGSDLYMHGRCRRDSDTE